MPSTDSSVTSSSLTIGLQPVEQIIVWLLAGQSESDIRLAIQATWPDADAGALQVEAVEHFARAAHFDIDVVNGWALEAYRDLYRRMVDIGDFAGAMRAVKELQKLAADVHREAEEGEEADEADSDPQTVAPAEAKRAKPRRAAKKRAAATKPRPRDSRRKGPGASGEVRG